MKAISIRCICPSCTAISNFPKPTRSGASPGSESSPNSLFGADIAPRIEVELTDFGVRIFSIRNLDDDKIYFRTSNFIMPNFSTFPGQTAAEGYSVNWHVPIDDYNHWKFVIVFSRKRALDRSMMLRGRDELQPDYRMIRTKANRYLQDRASMKDKTFSGIGYNFQAQDACVIEGAGKIQDRTKEHLVTSDKAIVAARKLLLKGIQDVKEGRDPLHVVRDAASRMTLRTSRSFQRSLQRPRIFGPSCRKKLPSKVCPRSEFNPRPLGEGRVRAIAFVQNAPSPQSSPRGRGGKKACAKEHINE